VPQAGIDAPAGDATARLRYEAGKYNEMPVPGLFMFVPGRHFIVAECAQYHACRVTGSACYEKIT
jgi:hypothetical protein